MTTLRVLLDSAPAPGRAVAWALFDAQERVLSSGHDAPERWPQAERKEAVLAAGCVRIAALKLPPLDRERSTAAATFALEDQLAGPAREQHITVSPQRSDGTLEAVIASRELVAATAATFRRVIAESTLAPRSDSGAWRWYASGTTGGFVRKPDGATFALSAANELPAELGLALAQASRAAAPPARVEVMFPVDDARLTDWSSVSGKPFVRAQDWRWQDAGPAAFAAAPDLLVGEFARDIAPSRSFARPAYRFAAGVAIAALVLHVAATFSEWAWLHFEQWRTHRTLATLAQDAGSPDSADPAAALARLRADARHHAGLAAPGDALPMLARAAPALAALPPGAVKTATYADRHWTFDLALPDAGAAAALEQRLNGAGLSMLQATRPGGLRARVALEAGAR
jgi:hypothetical protein